MNNPIHYPKYVMRLFKLLATDGAHVRRIIATDNYTLFFWRGERMHSEPVSHVTIDEYTHLFDEQYFWQFIPPQSKLTLNKRGHTILASLGATKEVQP